MNLLLKIAFALVISLLWFTYVFAQETLSINGYVRGEIGSSDLNNNSLLNPDNLLQRDTFSSKLTTLITAEAKLGNNANIVVGLKGETAATASQTSTVTLQEAYYKDIAGSFSYKIGKQFLAWGPGYAFNPSDVVNIQKNPTLVGVNQLLEGRMIYDFSYIPNDWLTWELIFPTEGVTSKDSIPVIVRNNVIFSGADVYLFGRFIGNGQPYYGGGVSYNLSDRLLFYSEALYKESSLITKVVASGSSFTSATVAEKPFNYLLGFNWAAAEDVSVIAEYYQNQENWTAADFGAFIDYLSFLRVNNPGGLPSALALYRPFGNSRDYTDWTISFSHIMNTYWGVSLGAIVNLSDGSYIARPQISYAVSDNLDISLLGNFFQGNSRSEFGNNPESYTLTLFVNTYF